MSQESLHSERNFTDAGAIAAQSKINVVQSSEPLNASDVDSSGVIQPF